MDERAAAVAVMAKMALMDGEIGELERKLLEDLLGTGPVVDEVLTYARGLPLDALIQRVERYEDRFFMAYRAFTVAAADHGFDIAELGLFNRLVRQLDIPDEDRRLILDTYGRLHASPPQDPDPRVMELYRASNFYDQDG
ncbi:MAG: hypothetical protein AAF488_00425 [Planctomycetota bacterium]